MGAERTVPVMILITGATGTIGSHVLGRLVDLGEPVRVLAREPTTVGVGAEVEVVRGDFEDPASLARAVDGVESAFLLTVPRKPVADHDLAFAEAAGAAGVSRIVKLSAIGSGETFGGARVGTWHRLAEQAVQASGAAWTVLRPSSFASNLLQFRDAIRKGAPVPNWTGTGAMGIIDPRDVAAVAVAALTTDDQVGEVHTLTGPELLTLDEQVAILGELLGAPVETTHLPLEAAAAMMLENGHDPTAVTEALLGMKAAKDGHFEILTGEVSRILGRPATSFTTWAADHLDAFR